MTNCIRKPTERVLVTGGSGFVGGYVLRYLQDCGFAVTNFDLIEDTQSNCEFIKGSILDFDMVQKAVDKSDIVFHFAGFSNINLVKEAPKKCIELNIMGTTNFVEAIRMKGSGRFVFASSVYVHNKNGHFYTTSKLASELICENYNRLYGLPVSVIRLGTAYGEKSRHEDVVSIFAKKAAAGEPLSIYGSGNQIRHFIHGEDIAEACLKLLQAKGLNGTFILSSSRGTSISELAEIVSKSGVAVKIKKFEGFGREDDYNGDMDDGSMVEDTYRKLQWRPQIDIHKGVKQLIEYFKGVA